MRQVRQAAKEKAWANPTPSQLAQEEVRKARKMWEEELLLKETMMVQKKLAVSLQLPTLNKSLS
eukprot:2459332-Pleurochrysis_carterae.AAC.1